MDVEWLIDDRDDILPYWFVELTMQGENGVIRMAASDGQIASGNRMQKLSDKTMSRVAFLAS